MRNLQEMHCGEIIESYKAGCASNSVFKSMVHRWIGGGPVVNWLLLSLRSQRRVMGSVRRKRTNRSIPLSKGTIKLACVLFVSQEQKDVLDQLPHEVSEDISLCEGHSPQQMERIRYAVVKLIARKDGKLTYLCCKNLLSKTIESVPVYRMNMDCASFKSLFCRSVLI